jgi:phospholipase/lecithinase/hemolysin
MSTTRRQWHLATLAAAAALVAAGCGGGDSGQTLDVGKVISFGDSLSDLGAYTPATQIPLGQPAGVAPFFGGKFTTNTHTGYTAASNSSTSNIWVEWVAARVGVAITAHEVGFGPQTVKCLAAATPALANSCTGYAQGGSRVSNPAGIGNPNGNGIVGTSPAPMTRPLTTQVANHLARFSGFAANDIVFVWGGHNDAFIQLGAVAAAATTPAAAVAAMQTAGAELATLVKNEILGKGAARVAVLNLVDISLTPGYSGLPAANKALLTQLTAEFNTALQAGLSGSSAQIVDVRTYLGAVTANPSIAGLTNATVPVCDRAKIAAFTANRVTDGSSLFCNAAPASAFTAPVPILNALKVGTSASTHLYADDVHPTTGGHRATADFVWSQLQSFGWVPNNL